VNEFQTDDLRISKIKPLISPAVLSHHLPITDKVSKLVATARQDCEDILKGKDDRLLVIVGPCSIHDPGAAIEYATRIKEVASRYTDDLLVVMRVYFEKPRTTVGWKGLINDPHLDGSFDINQGLHIARELLIELAEIGIPAGTEFLDTISPQYYADLITWGAIGARTTESQIHSKTAPVARSKLHSMPFKPLQANTISSPLPNKVSPPSLPPKATTPAISFCAAHPKDPTTMPKVLLVLPTNSRPPDYPPQ